MENIEKINFQEIMEESFMDYSMETIVNRNIPSIKDGLKSVQRRILYTARKLNLVSTGNYSKSARLVGETMGKYHPHGDSSIYNALTGIANDYNLRYPLLKGQGNFGNIDGDKPASMRYTEIKLSKFGDIMTNDLDEDIINFIPNFDETTVEAAELSALLPNLLINGTDGVAVGFTTSIPSHNLSEVVKVIKLLMDKPDADVEQILSLMPGPDFITGGIVRPEGIRDYYETGKGKFTIESKWHVEKLNTENIVHITEIPFGEKKQNIVIKIIDKLDEYDTEGNILEVADQTDLDSIDIAIRVKNNVNINEMMNYLFQKTPLSKNFNVTLVAINENHTLREYTLREIVLFYIDYQTNIYYKKFNKRLKELKIEIEKTEGLIKAIDNIHDVVDIIQNCKNNTEVKNDLRKLLKATIRQVEYILSMRLSSIQRIEKDKEESNLKKLNAEKEKIEKIIKNDKLVHKEIIKDLEFIVNSIDDKRRTTITDKPQEDLAQVVESDFYIYYNENEIILSESKDTSKDKTFDLVNIKSSDDILIIFKDGSMTLKKSSTLSHYESDVDIASVVGINHLDSRDLFTISKDGYIKSTSISDLLDKFRKSRDDVVDLMNVSNSEIFSALLLDKDSEIIVVSDDKFLRTTVSDVRNTGFNTKGVVLIKLSKGSSIINVIDIKKYSKIMLYDDKKEKTFKLSDITLQNRATQGRSLQGFKHIVAYNNKKEIKKS